MKLYGYWRSSSSYRARIFLNLKGLSYERAPVHLLNGGGEQYGETFEAMNPLHQVPVLEVDGTDGPRYLTQSVAIMEWLEETHPEPPLFPADPWLRARAREMVEIINSGIQPLQNLRVLQSLKAWGANPREWCHDIITQGLGALEARMAQTAGRHAVGDRLGVVEACLIPQTYAARRFQVDLEKYPTLMRVEEACRDHPAFAAAHPDAQPEAPPPDARTP